jgi:hypothetical protein
MKTSKPPAPAPDRLTVLEHAPHPARVKLDALAAGDSGPALAKHVDSCAECMQYVASLQAQISAADEFSGPAAEAFSQTTERAAAQASITQLHSALQPRRRWQTAGYATTALAMAAGLALFLHTSRPMQDGSAEAPAASNSTGAATLGSVADQTGSSSNVQPPTERFKGGPTVAIVRERAGAQLRATGALQLKSNDRIRLEVTTPGGVPIAAGVLSDTGAYFPLVPAEELAAGTHFSRDSMRFDAEPFRGWVVWGPPDKIIEVQRTRDVQSVQFLAISVAP